MPPISLSNFLLSLAYALAQIAPEMAMGSSLWAMQADESRATDPYTVLRVYGGPEPEGLLRVPAVSVQAMTVATDASAAIDAANGLYEALYDDQNTPRHEWVIAGKQVDEESGEVVDDEETNWEIRLLIPGPAPGTIGRDDRGRTQAVFNFDVRFQPKEIT
jgi:hypothetical protein